MRPWRENTWLALWGGLLASCGGAETRSLDPTWQVVFDDLPGGILRVYGTSATDVYAIGADADGKGPIVLHFDGERWHRLETAASGDLWWIARVGDDDLRMAGEGGLVLRYRPSRGTFERLPTPGLATLFGLWSKSDRDVWYVGGEVSRQAGVVWRDDGETIRAVPVLSAETSTTGTFFKVEGWDDGLWIVGQRGQTIFWDGTRFERRTSGTSNPLLTVHGLSAARAWAVGGLAEGTILRYDGAAWQDESIADVAQLNGVWATSEGEAYAVGFNGSVYRRSTSGWAAVESVPTFRDLHSVWVDERGGVWLGGGQLASDPPTHGVVVYYGPEISKSIESGG